MYKTDIWNLGPEHAQSWEIRQGVLAGEIFHKRVIPLLVQPLFDPQDISQELRNFTDRLIGCCALKLAQGKKENPFHHSFQVLENMLWILRYELDSFNKKNIKRTKMMIALALLHDIGDAEVEGKVKTSQIKEAIEAGRPRQEIEGLVQGAIKFRKHHMMKGAKIAAGILNSHFLGDFSVSQIYEIYRTIIVHDTPTIAFILNRFGQYAGASDSSIESCLFLNPKNGSAVLLREADRMWMVSFEGVEKDLMDKVTAEGKTSKSPEEQLAYNLKRFELERALYDKVLRLEETSQQFQKDTFFRNQSSFALFKKLLKQWHEFPEMKKHEKLAEIFAKYLRN